MKDTKFLIINIGSRNVTLKTSDKGKVKRKKVKERRSRPDLDFNIHTLIEEGTIPLSWF